MDSQVVLSVSKVKKYNRIWYFLYLNGSLYGCYSYDELMKELGRLLIDLGEV